MDAAHAFWFIMVFVSAFQVFRLSGFSESFLGFSFIFIYDKDTGEGCIAADCQQLRHFI